MEPARFGRYEVQGKLGKGGFADVYLAFDPQLARKVAVKVCRSDDEVLRRRFSHEAQLVADLHHPNVTTVFDLGLENGIPYLVQEYLSGEDLSRKIERREAVPMVTKLRWLVGIAHGLAYAHGRGIIHRDIKPSNIRVLDDGRVKIMDFGIAKLMAVDHGLTAEGMRVGTAGYLAPEQIQGTAVDQRADLFTYGVLAYELLSYQRPFGGEEISAIIYRILQVDPQPLTERCRDCPPLVASLIGTCLEKDPAHRFSSFAELLPTLESQVERAAEPGPTQVWSETVVLSPTEIVSKAPVSPPPPSVSPAGPPEPSGFLTAVRSQRPIWVLGGGILLALALGVVALLRPVPQLPSSRLPAPDPVEAKTEALEPRAAAPAPADTPKERDPLPETPATTPPTPIAAPSSAALPSVAPEAPAAPSVPPPVVPARPRLFLRVIAGGGTALEAAEQALIEELSTLEGITVTFDTLAPTDPGAQAEEAALGAARSDRASLAVEARLAWDPIAQPPRLTLRLRLWDATTGTPLGQEDLGEVLSSGLTEEALGAALGQRGAAAVRRIFSSRP
jgi:serine/threonine protein kinase